MKTAAKTIISASVVGGLLSLHSLFPSICKANQQTVAIDCKSTSHKLFRCKIDSDSYLSTGSIPDTETEQCKLLWTSWHERLGSKLIESVYRNYRSTEKDASEKACEVSFSVKDGKLTEAPHLVKRSDLASFDQAVLSSLEELSDKGMEPFPTNSKAEIVTEDLLIHLDPIRSKLNQEPPQQACEPRIVSKIFHTDESLLNNVEATNNGQFDTGTGIVFNYSPSLLRRSEEVKRALDAWHLKLAGELIGRFNGENQSLRTGLGQRSSQISYRIENGELISAVISKSSGYAAFDKGLLKSLKSLNNSLFLKPPKELGTSSMIENLTLSRDLGASDKKPYIQGPIPMHTCTPENYSDSPLYIENVRKKLKIFSEQKRERHSQPLPPENTPVKTTAPL